ncbi:uncharacterized protein NDAI_0A03800 [Naumovozyma dairenensis CBS 421]|uniref:Glycosyltransferase family 32 protein n=1 Tax=Naumovozyma dairenensis (strain ATCC 10597 / BCRC 20456 / CBS 421 / NBRC 0211 / NRRL Y-12639) TaxID=1071378 RepID=G0W3Z9_NAUDC|nr:hypothetical protein NDAI_0A03800 [Naumovozyma dairenensis CBS 421]CCD22537.1 hypothetical protein NDAI_0A03800 [Naumovozyma dairenensis CBS 421]
MSKTRSTRNIVHLKRLIWIIISLIIAIFLLIRFLNNNNANNLQVILQNLPKEISQSINTVSSKQKSDQEILQKFEKLTKQLKKSQEDQTRQFERQRKILEKKIQELKPPLSDATIREKLTYQFPYDPIEKFPAFIWQTWSNDIKLEQLMEIKDIWDSQNPGFVHEILNDDISEALIHHYYSKVPEVIKAYNYLPSRILKIDFFKYLILLARGGIYADVDTKPLQPVPNWIPEAVVPSKIGLIIGIEHDAKKPDWRSNFVRRLQFGTWIIQSKPGHPILREMVAVITEETLKENEDSLNINVRNDLDIMSWTGSGVWTDVIFKYFNDYMKSGINGKVTWKKFHNMILPRLISDVLIFPEFSFKAPLEFDKTDMKRNLYLVHHEGAKFWKAAPTVEN